MTESRLRACQTMARNIADIKGTSVISPSGWARREMSMARGTAVATMITPNTISVDFIRQTRKPYRIVRLTQMKWKGTVSQAAKTQIAPTSSTAKPPQATSIQRKRLDDQGQRSGRINPISLAAHGLDRFPAELGAEPADVDIDDIGAAVEPVTPDGGKQALLADGVAGAGHQLP